MTAPAFAHAAAARSGKPPWRALWDPVAAAEIVLGRVCLPGIAEHRSIAELASREYLLPVAPQEAATDAETTDQAWRLAAPAPVYAVAWADGQCTTYVDGGSAEKLRAMADRVIRARPERFIMISSGIVGAGLHERTIYCGGIGDVRITATITTPGPAYRGIRRLSSTVYNATPGGLCYGIAKPPAKTGPGSAP